MYVLEIINMLVVLTDTRRTGDEDTSIVLHTFNDNYLSGLNEHNDLQKYMFLILKHTTHDEITIKRVIVEVYLTDKYKDFKNLEINDERKELSVKFEIPLSKYDGILTPCRHNCDLITQYFYNTLNSIVLDKSMIETLKGENIFFNKENILIVPLEFFNILQVEFGVFRIKIHGENDKCYVSECFRVNNTLVNINDQFVKGDLGNLDNMEYTLEYIDNRVLQVFNNMIYSVFNDKVSYKKGEIVYFVGNLVFSICGIVGLLLWIVKEVND